MQGTTKTTEIDAASLSHRRARKYIYLADTLYHMCIPGENNADMEEELSTVVHSLVLNIPVSANKLSEIRQATEQDPTLKKGISS